MKLWQSLVTVVLLGLTSAVAEAEEPLVDCSKKAFQRDENAKSLFSWNSQAEGELKSMLNGGTFNNPDSVVKGRSKGTVYCKKVLGDLGSAWCKEPKNEAYRDRLKRLMALCDKGQSKPKPAKVKGVNCSDKKFTHPSANIDQLLSWVDMSMRSLEGLDENEAYRVKPICADALKYAGTAYCKDGTNPKAIQAIKKVQAKCQTSQKQFSDDKTKAEAANKASIAKAKANRKIVKFPKVKYKGSGKAALAKAMRKAMLASRNAKKTAEMLKVQPAGAWNKGRYKNKVSYKAIMGVVLWADDDNDGICRFTSYNFIKDKKGGRWSKLRFRSFCNGCHEGWIKCK